MKKRKERSEYNEKDEENTEARCKRIKTEADQNSFFSLPQELMQIIFLELQQYQLADVATVCQSWSKIISAPHFWKKYCINQWGENIIPNNFETNPQNVDSAEYFIPTLSIKDREVVDWRRYARVRSIYVQLYSEFIRNQSKLKDVTRRDAMKLKDLQDLAMSWTEFRTPSHLITKLSLFLINAARLFYRTDKKLIRRISAQLSDQHSHFQQNIVSSALLDFFDESFDELKSHDREITALFSAICSHVQLKENYVGDFQSQKLCTEVVRRLIKLAELTHPKKAQSRVIKSPYPDDKFIPRIIDSDIRLSSNVVTSILSKIAKVLHEVYFDEKMDSRQRAAVFKVMDITSIHNVDFGMSLFQIIKHAIVHEKNKEISTAALVALIKLVNNYSFLFNDEFWIFVFTFLIDSMVSLLVDEIIGPLSDALFGLLASKENLRFISDQQFNDINMSILRAIKGVAENKCQEEQFLKISQLGVFGQKMLKFLPHYRDAFNACRESLALRRFSLNRHLSLESCESTFVRLLYEIGEPETKDEARDLIKKIICGEISAGDIGTIMGFIGYTAFDLFADDNNLSHQIMQILLRSFPDDCRTGGQVLGHKRERDNEEKFPVSGTEWGKKIQRYLDYSKKLVYFIVPEKPWQIESDINTYNVIGAHHLNALSALFKVARSIGRTIIPYAQELMEITAYTVLFGRISDFIEDFIWLFNVVFAEISNDEHVIMYFLKMSFFATQELWLNWIKYRPALIEMHIKTIEIVLAYPASFDSHFISLYIEEVHQMQKVDKRLNFKLLVYKFVEGSPKAFHEGLHQNIWAYLISGDNYRSLSLDNAHIIALLGVTYGIHFLMSKVVGKMMDPTSEEEDVLGETIKVVKNCLQYISFDTTSEENTYLKKFVILVSACQVDSLLITLHAFNVFEYDWKLFQEAISSPKFDTGNEALNDIVRKSDKSLHFWLTLE